MTEDFVYCPRCGAPLTDRLVSGRVRRACRYCGFVHFHDPKVAVAALVSDGQRVLLVRRGVFPRQGYWALPAGYMDHDELPEETVVREIAEETGISVRLDGLQAVIPLGGWDERRGILLVYRALALSPGQPRGADDVDEAAWFQPDDVPWSELAFPSTGALLREWVASRPTDDTLTATTGAQPGAGS